MSIISLSCRYPRVKVQKNTRKSGVVYAFFLNESRSGVRFTDHPLSPTDESKAYESILTLVQLELSETAQFAMKTARELVLADQYVKTSHAVGHTALCNTPLAFAITSLRWHLMCSLHKDKKNCMLSSPTQIL